MWSAPVKIITTEGCYLDFATKYINNLELGEL